MLKHLLKLGNENLRNKCASYFESEMFRLFFYYLIQKFSGSKNSSELKKSKTKKDQRIFEFYGRYNLKKN